MPVSVSGNNWEKIRQGIKDAQLLNSQRKYNLSMVKCRQTLEFMVQDLCDKAMITPKNSNQDLSSLIDELYASRWISKTTCEHYHKIRMLGNKAVHEGNENAYDANQACQLLSHEVVTFSKDYMNDARPQPRQRPVQRTAAAGSGSGSGSSGDNRSRSAGESHSRKRSAGGFPLTTTDLMRILIVVIAVIVVFALINILRSGGGDEEETSSSAPTSSYEAEQPTDETPEDTTAANTIDDTMADTTPAPVYKTTATLNVRSEPNTDCRVLGQLAPDTIINYLGDYNESWAIIDYDGTQAYVSKNYLTHD